MRHHQLIGSLEYRIIVWMLLSAGIGLAAGLRVARSEENAYRGARRSARSGGRRREEAVYVLSLKAGN